MLKGSIESLAKDRLMEIVEKYKKSDEKEEDEAKDDKNKGSQLDGVLRDVLSWWENVIYQNSISEGEIWINSANSTFSNSIKRL